MEIEDQSQSASWRFSLLFSVFFLNICLPSLLLSYGVLLVQFIDFGYPVWLGFFTPTIYIITFNLTQCWFRDAADSWGGPIGYRVMASLGVMLLAVSVLICAFLPYYLHPFSFGILGGMGSSLVSAQVDAVIFDIYDSKFGIVRSLCISGQAIGQTLFPHIITVMIELYGYPFSHIIFSAVILQALPAIMLLKVDHTFKKPATFSRYSDVAKTYAMLNNEVPENIFKSTELQLHDMGKKCWKSPSDDNLHREEENFDEYDCDGDDFITIPSSPEEKRRNIFGVEILPEIPEESEDDSEDQSVEDNASIINKNKKRLSVAIKRLSTLGDSFDEFIAKQLRRDSNPENEKEYQEIEVTFENISPITDMEREKIFNSFSFRCQSAYANLKRRLWMPSYRTYRLKRRLLYFMYNINDTFIKPLTRSLTCWRFYPALMLCFVRMCLTAISLPLMPLIASRVKPKISTFETNYLMSLHAFTWICFLLSTPWLVETPKRNLQYVVLIGIMISTTASFVLAEASNHDSFSIGCIVAGLGYGAVASCWDSTIKDFVGVRMWPKLHSTLETLSVFLLASFTFGLSFVIEKDGGYQYCMFILASATALVAIVWLIIATYSLYTTKMRSLRLGRRCLSF